MTTKLENLESAVKGVIGERLVQSQLALGELTVVVSAKDYLQVMRDLRDSAATQFDQLIDLCGVYYSSQKGIFELIGVRHFQCATNHKHTGLQI